MIVTSSIVVVLVGLMISVNFPPSVLQQQPSQHAAVEISGGTYDLLYYFDVEPKEQKYLRMGTTYDQMIRRNAAAAASSVHRPVTMAPVASSTVELEMRLSAAGRIGPLALPAAVLHEETPSSQQQLVTLTEAAAMRASLESLKIRQLRRMLKEKEAECNGCVERHHLVERIMEVRGWLSRADANLMALVVLQDSAAVRPLPYHYGEVPQLPAEHANALVQQQQHEALVRHQLDCSLVHHNNATVLCVPKAVAA